MKREPGRVRTLRFEVYWENGGDHKPTRQRWLRLADQVQEAINCTWQSWLVWHVQKGTPAKLRRYYAERRKWHEACDSSRPPRDAPKKAFAAWERDCKASTPKPPDVKPIDNSCAKFIYDQVAAACPDLNTSTRELARNVTQGKITGSTAAKGGLPAWHAVLLCRQSIPSSTRAQPIPFTKKPEQTRIYPPDANCKRWRVTLRIDRQDRPGKTATSTVDNIELRTDVRGIFGHTKILRDILNDKAELCGSALSYDSRRNKWYVLISYRQAALPLLKLDKAQVAHLIPLCDRPAALLLPDGYALNLMGMGRPVEYKRRQLLLARFGRNENYRYSQRAGRGHGRQRAIGWKDKFERSWRNWCTSFNRCMVKQVIDACKARGIGKIVYCQPEGDKGDTRFLARAGKLTGRTDASGWPWFQVATFIKESAADAGIEVEVRKWSKKNKRDREAA